MTRSNVTVALLLSAVIVFPAAARKNRPEAAAKPSAPSGAAVANESSAVAKVGGTVITLAELDLAAAGKLAKLRQQQYDVRSEVLAGLIQDRVIMMEAAAKGITKDELFESEVTAKTAKPTPEEIALYFETAKARLRGMSLAEASGEIERLLAGQAATERQRVYRAELDAKYPAEVLLEPPRSTITLRPGAPALGPVNAPVTMVAWSDYQCPFCRRVHPTLEQVLGEYAGRLRFVHLDYPLSNHALAIPAAHAVHCAAEQGKFWEYNDHLYANSGDLGPADLARRAAEVGLDAAAFAECVASNRHADLIQANHDAGAALGVGATPAFFINGRMLVGALPIERFRTVIDEELARAGASVPAAAAGTN